MFTNILIPTDVSELAGSSSLFGLDTKCASVIGARSYIEDDAADIERTIVAIASMPNSSLAVLPDSTTTINRDLIIKLAARHRLPAIYNGRVFVVSGGLMSYGFIYRDQYLQAASYVDQILRGAKPSDLPVQTPTRYSKPYQCNLEHPCGAHLLG